MEPGAEVDGAAALGVIVEGDVVEGAAAAGGVDDMLGEDGVEGAAAVGAGAEPAVMVAGRFGHPTRKRARTSRCHEEQASPSVQHVLNPSF